MSRAPPRPGPRARWLAPPVLACVAWLLLSCEGSAGTGSPGGGGFAHAGGGSGGCVPSGPEICNDADDDCDGFVDEDLPDLVCDGRFACGLTGPSCELGQVRTCRDVFARLDVCGNDLDDDCDGLVDCEDPDCGEPRTLLEQRVYGGGAARLEAGGWLVAVTGPEPFTGDPGVAWLLRVSSRGVAGAPQRLDGQLRSRLLRGGEGTTLWLVTSGGAGVVARQLGDDGAVLATHEVAGPGENLSGAALEPTFDTLALLLTGESVQESTFLRVGRSGAPSGSPIRFDDPTTRFATLLATSAGTFVVRSGMERVVLQSIDRGGEVVARELDATPDRHVIATGVEDGSLLLVIGDEVLHVTPEARVLSRRTLPPGISGDASGATLYPAGEGFVLAASRRLPGGRTEIVATRIAAPDATPSKLEHVGPGDTPLLVEPSESGLRVFAGSFTGGVTLLDTQYCGAPPP